jgi:hypothetical protein
MTLTSPGDASCAARAWAGAATAGIAALAPSEASAAELKQTEVTFGDGKSSSFPITHGLSSPKPHVIVVNKTTNKIEGATIEYTSATVVTISAEVWQTTPPATNAYTAVFIG